MERFTYLLLGILAGLVVVLLFGFNGGGDIGRYQVAAAATTGQAYYWVVDTVSGDVVLTNFVPERPVTP